MPFFQNAKRRAGRLTAPARLNLPRYGLKKPEIACLPTAYAETLPFPPLNRAFVLPSRYGMTIVKIRGVSPRIPTLFCVRRAPGYPGARLLHDLPAGDALPADFA